MEYTIVMFPTSIICKDGKLKGARPFYHGPCVKFYISGATGKRSGAAINVMMNKAIEMGISLKDIKRDCGCSSRKVKIAKGQRKLL